MRLLLVERRRATRLVGAAIPVARVRDVAFFAMEIGVHPGCIRGLFGLGEFVRLVPVAFGVPPEGGEQRRQRCRGLRLRERGAELLECHGAILVKADAIPLGFARVGMN